MPHKDLTEKSVNAFLDELAARTPSPGGGAAAAAIGALAAAMGRMVLAYSLRETPPATLVAATGRLRQADELLRALITQDAEAYDRMSSVTRAARKDASLQEAAQRAVLEAMAVPLQMAALAAETLNTLDEVKRETNRFLVSDLGVAAVASFAAAEAAAYNVKINAGQLRDEQARRRVLADVDRAVERARGCCASIRNYVSDQMT